MTRRYLHAAGLNDDAIRHRVERGRLIELHPNVFITGGTPLTWRGGVLAACDWSCGLASHRSAAALWGLAGFTGSGRPHVVVSHCHLPPRSGIIVHATDFLPRSHRTHVGPIPTTSIERTILDLGAAAKEIQVAAALDDAVCRGLTSLAALHACLRVTARKGRRGCGVLRRLLAQRTDLRTVPNSPLETRAFQALVTSSLPPPRLQFEIFDERGDFVARPDFAWPDRRFAVEMDGFRFHSSAEQFRRDRARLNRLTRARWKVMFGTWPDAEADPEEFASQVEQAYFSCS